MTIRERVRSVGLALAVVACGAAAALVFRPEPASPEAEAAIALPKSKVSFRLVDTSTGKETTAMVCLTRLDDETIRLPPDGRVMKKVGRTDEFYRGLEYDKSKTDWVGPVRKMAGKGDNNDRSYVYGEILSVPYWREPVSFQTNAKFSVELEDGNYRLSVSRGMEFVPVRHEFSVSAGVDSETAIRLARWVDFPKRGWYSGDVHVHHPTLTDKHRDFLLHYAEAEDLHLVNVLEMGHHRGTDFKQTGFGKAHRTQRGSYALVSGQEEPRSTFGHIIGLHTTKLARDLPTYDFYDLAFQRLHDQKQAVVGFAHFSWNGCDLPRGFPWYVTTEAIEFIELMQFAKVNALDYYDYLNLGFRLTAAAGSDIPWGSTLGECRTYVYTGPKFDVDAWFDGLRRGRTFVSNGPALELRVEGEFPGAELQIQKGARVRVSAKAWGHSEVAIPEVLELVTGAGVVQRRVRKVDEAKDRTELSISIDLPFERSGWIALSTRATNGALAHSSPVYVVVDGQPTWSPSQGPEIIGKQLAAMRGIEREFANRDDARSRGVRERLKRAELYYARLSTAMQAAE